MAFTHQPSTTALSEPVPLTNSSSTPSACFWTSTSSDSAISKRIVLSLRYWRSSGSMEDANSSSSRHLPTPGWSRIWVRL